MNTKRAIHHMTWKEVKEVYEKDPVILIPLGSMEEHGPHSVTGDFMAATEIASRVAKEANAYYVPTVPFGNSEYFRGYPGTISLRQETVVALLDDICRSLIEHGITKIVFFNGHAGNAPAIDQVARKVKREHDLYVVSVDLWQMLSPVQKKEVYGDGEDPSGHGGEPLSSVMSYLRAEDMRMDLLPEKNHPSDEWKGFSIESLAKVNLNGVKVNAYLDMEEISPEGIMGNPYKASAERGENIVGHLVKTGVELVKTIQEQKMTK